MVDASSSQPLPEDIVGRQHRFRLSGEVVIEILCHVSPYDVISMRKTCRFIFDVTKTRIVWLNALERMCDRHGVFKPTFPVERMSILELEYAALGPRRFLNMLQSIPVNEHPLPHSNRELICRRRPPLTGAYTCEALYLAAGGRFLLLHGEDNTLSLWDMGYHAHVPMKQHAIATLESCGELMAASQSTDGEGIVLVTRQIGRQSNASSLVVFEVRPPRDGRRSTSTFAEVARLQCANPPPRELNEVRINSQVVVVRSSRLFYVWDWSAGKGVSWKPSIDLSSSYTSKTAVLEKTLLVNDDDGKVYNWDIPTLHPLMSSDMNHFPVVTNEPKASIPSSISSDLSVVNVHIRCTAETHRRPLGEPDPVLCALYDEGEVLARGVKSHLSLFSVRDMGDRADAFLPNTLLLPAGSCEHVFGTQPDRFYGAMTSLYQCEDKVIFCADTSDSSVIVSALPIPSRADLGNIASSLVSRRLLPADMLHEEYSEGSRLDFCPVSGRLAFRAADGSLYLRDFLSAPDLPELYTQ